MKVAILAGGLGSRLQEETTTRPKPMIEIGGKPILWHILNLYAAQGFVEFVLALGYKGESVKEYFLHWNALNNDLTVGFFEECLFGELGDPGIARQLTKDVRRLEEADLDGVDAVVHPHPDFVP